MIHYHFYSISILWYPLLLLL